MCFVCVGLGTLHVSGGVYMNDEMKSIIPTDSIATISNSVRRKMANKEINVKKGNAC